MLVISRKEAVGVDDGDALGLELGLEDGLEDGAEEGAEEGAAVGGRQLDEKVMPQFATEQLPPMPGSEN
jgi:hypothetical protein